MAAMYKPCVQTAKSLFQGVNCNILFCGFLAEDWNNISACWSSLLGKKKKELNKKPQNLISIMAVLILQTEDDILTEHSNDTKHSLA